MTIRQCEAVVLDTSVGKKALAMIAAYSGKRSAKRALGIAKSTIYHALYEPQTVGAATTNSAGHGKAIKYHFIGDKAAKAVPKYLCAQVLG